MRQTSTWSKKVTRTMASVIHRSPGMLENVSKSHGALSTSAGIEHIVYTTYVRTRVPNELRIASSSRFGLDVAGNATAVAESACIFEVRRVANPRAIPPEAKANFLPAILRGGLEA